MLSLAALSACGPMSPENAAKFCEDRAYAALGPTGAVGVSHSSSGNTYSFIQLGITSDFIFGRDPYDVYESCVHEKSGQGPIRPLILDGSA